jgi:hypothetical protein
MTVELKKARLAPRHCGAIIDHNLKTSEGGEKMQRTSLIRALLVLAIMLPVSMVAQGELVITWTGVPGQLESTITADTLADGTQAHDVYVLEANKIYLQRTEINVNSSFTVRGQEPGPGERPAVVQPLPGDDGVSGFTGWPGGNFQVYGEGAVLTLDNLIFTGAFADQSGHVWSVVNTRGVDNKVVVTDNVWTDYQIGFMAFGTDTDFHFTNSINKACPSYPGGVFFNGFAWGAGSWMGTIDTLVVQNSSIVNMFGEALVIYDQVGTGLVDHCTFANIAMGIAFYRGQNNMTFSNNLFYNVKTYGQSTNGVGLWGGVESGQGMMAILSQPAPDSATVANGRGWDHLNRNISYHHNAWYNDSAVQNFWDRDPWQWTVEASDGSDSTVYDTMFAVSAMNKWVGDTTLAIIEGDASITQYNNVQTTESLALDPEYITRQLDRIWDYRDDNIFQTYTTEWWQYEHDNDMLNVEWPIHEDLSYDASSPAATASETGGPVGDPRWSLTTSIDDKGILPNKFSLEQNFPNPFNPTTAIEFSLESSSDIQLTIYNVIGQEIRTLASGMKQAGAHTISWDGRNESGKMVSTGIYMYKLSVGNQSMTKKMAFIK